MPRLSPFSAEHLDTTLKLAGGFAALWALQARMTKLQIEMLRQGGKLALTTLDRTAATSTALLQAGLRRPWAR